MIRKPPDDPARSSDDEILVASALATDRQPLALLWARRLIWLSAGASALLIAMACGVYLQSTYWSLDSAAEAQSRNQSTPTGRATSASDSAFNDVAKQAGIKVCTDTFNALGNALTSGTRYAVQSNWSNKNADAGPIRALVGMNYETANYKGPAVGIVYASPVTGGCIGNMVRVVQAATACSEIEKILPQGSAETNKLAGLSLFSLAGGRQGEAMLLPIGEQGCVVVSIFQGGNTR